MLYAYQLTSSSQPLSNMRAILILTPRMGELRSLIHGNMAKKWYREETYLNPYLTPYPDTHIDFR